MSLIEAFDRISTTSVDGGYELFLINLAHRNDRRKESLTILNNGVFKVNIFNAISAPIGWHGCAMSHLSLIKYAKEKNLDHIIVAEDDLQFKVGSDVIANTIKTLVENVDKWEIFNGSPTFWGIRHDLKLLTVTESFAKDLAVLNWGQSTTFMIYNRSCYEEMLQYKIDDGLQIDQFIAKNFKQIVYTPSPFCIQRQSFSDIGKIQTDSQYENYFIKQHDIIHRRLLNLPDLIDPEPVKSVRARPIRTRPIQPLRVRPIRPLRVRPTRPLRVRPIRPLRVRPPRPLKVRPTRPLRVRPVRQVRQVRERLIKQMKSCAIRNPRISSFINKHNAITAQTAAPITALTAAPTTAPQKNCVVTAYYKIRSKFNYDQYMHWIKNFVNNVSCDIILFTSSDLVDTFKNFNKRNITIIEQDIKDLYFNKHHLQDFEAQWHNDPIKDRRSPSLYILWHNKLKFIEHAHHLYGNTYENYIWCDIGAYREEHLFKRRSSFGTFKGKLDKMTVLALQEPQPKDFVKHNDGLHGMMTNDDIFLGGGILALPHDKVIFYNQMLTDVFEKLRKSNRFYGCDQRLYACMYGEFPNEFTIIRPPEKYTSDRWFYMLDYLS